MNHSIYEGFIDELHTNVQNNYQSVANIFEHEYIMIFQKTKLKKVKKTQP